MISVRRALVGAWALAAILAAGCGGGGDESQPTSQVASLAPADAPLYAEAALRPEGDLRSGAEEAARKLFATDDPGARVQALVDQALADSEQTYAEDVEPWLGESGAIWFKSFGDKPDGAIILEATDAARGVEAARKAEESSGSDKPEDRSYESVDYTYYPNDDNAVGEVDGHVVIGSEEGFKQTVDVSRGAVALADATDYKDTVANATDQRLASLYIEPKGFFEALSESGELPPEARDQIENRFGELASTPLFADATADGDQVAIELSGGAAPSELVGGENSLLSELPENSWAAFGLSDLGGRIDAAIEQVESVPGVGKGELSDRFGAQTGLDLKALSSWLGDVAVFGRGTDLQGLGGGAVAESTDQAASKGDIARISKAIERASGGNVTSQRLTLPGGGDGVTLTIPGFPIPIQFAQRGDRVVLALGNDAAQEAFGPSGTLGDSSEFARANEALGGGLEISGYVSVPPIIDLVDNLGAGADPDYQQAKPYLESADFLVYGSGKDGGRSIARAVLGLK